MGPQMENPDALAGANPGWKVTSSRNDNTVRPRKWIRVLRAFYSGRTLNRFEAERTLSDHCLHSTVSGLQDRGLVIARESEKVPGYMGIPTEVCRYWLAPESRQKAAKLLGEPIPPANEENAPQTAYGPPMTLEACQ